MQGQTRQQGGDIGGDGSPIVRQYQENAAVPHRLSNILRNKVLKPELSDDNHSGTGARRSYSLRSRESSYECDSNPDKRSTSDFSNGDNISTTPLKSIVSVQSTQSPSILSDNNQDQTSGVASTAETSLAPSVHTTATAFTPTPNTIGYQERDSESIVTLASSSRRIRRRSIDTNCSTAGIPPASIMERLSTQPTAANSSYAVSIKTNDRAEPSQSSTNDPGDLT